MDFFARILLYIIPLYIANSSAMLLGGKTALDFGKKFFDNRELFGKGKTWKGTVFGVLAGTTAALLISIAFPEQTTRFFSNYLALGFLLALGAITGDLVGSFTKRRLSLGRGTPVLLLDQLDFVAGAIVFGSPIFLPGIKEIAFIVVLTLIIHKLSNYIAFKMKIKRVPW